MAVVKDRGKLSPDDPVYKEGWTMNIGGLQGTEPKNESSEAKPRRGGATFRGFAKPDDPIYREGWSIHIGPLLGTVPPSPPTQQPSVMPEESTSRKRKRKAPKKKRTGR